jgi:hypothetical protein
MVPGYAYSQDAVLAQEKAFFRSVYNWMVAGLALTGGVAWLVASSPSISGLIFGSPFLLIGLIIGELALVWILASRVQQLSVGAASTIFLAYSALNGLTLSSIFIVYAHSVIFSAFMVSAGVFAGMSFYGYVTKRSLASWGGFLIMGLWGIILATVVNIFVSSRMLDWMITYAGVLIFTGLTAYDTQRLRYLAQEGFEGEDMATKSAVVGALALYLDFINLFLMILRIFAASRD